MEKRKDVFLILLDIRSAENVGAIFRTADAVDVSKIVLVGTTPSPIDRFGRPRKDIAKAALGAEKTIPFEYCKTPTALIVKLKKARVQIVAIEQSASAVDYKKIKISYPVAFIVGNEVNGIPKKILDLVDTVAQIPMRGKKESLNVSVATGVALYRMLNI